MRVVLPAPFSPTRPRISPGLEVEADVVQDDVAVEFLRDVLEGKKRTLLSHIILWKALSLPWLGHPGELGTPEARGGREKARGPGGPLVHD